MQNFGKIKNIFNNLMIESIFKKDENSKKLFKKYVKTIKESEILKTQFLIYNNIENKVDTDQFSVNIFVNENIKLLEKYDKSKILKENNKLSNLLKNVKYNVDEEYDLSKLHESISNLIFIKREAANVDKITSEIKNVVTHIVSNKVNQDSDIKESFGLPISFLSKMLVENFNEKYSFLDESDKEVLNIIINENFEVKKDFYLKIKEECSNLIGENTTNDESYIEKSRQVKIKLEEDLQTLTEDNFNKKILKLLELKNNLNN
jgi:predicted thioredoxin/glutaredoxin